LAAIESVVQGLPACARNRIAATVGFSFARTREAEMRGDVLRTHAAVFVLEREDFARNQLVPGAPVPRRRSANKSVLVGIVAAHVAAAYVAAGFTAESVDPVETDSLVAVNIRPRVVVSRLPSVPPPQIRLPRTVSLVYDLPVPEFDRPTLAVLGVGTMPPTPDDGAIDPTQFARRAGLLAGEGATVVLRVEVLGSGELGRIEVDVSGGTDEVDRAAIAYMRAVTWTGGMIEGVPATIWIRWGVRLQG
jgi:TonB family protein